MRALLRVIFRLALFCPVILLVGCAASGKEKAAVIAASAGLREQIVTTSLFSYQSFQRIADPALPVNVYIEGDGRAWISRTQPSSDPTPSEPVALYLAARDPAKNVVWLARPCQFVGAGDNLRCQQTYWTDKRFAPEIIDSMSQAIDRILQHSGTKKIALTGYSGGGTVAALLAAKRQDVVSLRTVAGYLDIAWVNQQHRVSPMPDSLNPIETAVKTAAIPQIHFSGESDAIISPAVAQRFVRSVGGRCARAMSIPAMTHRGPWETPWPTLLTIAPGCGQ
ncbi:alpha/beta hydrolase family protein [Enterobacter sp. BIGb0383]|uniref:alpha/beta fold hydrolase n=1 Tax=unclassified Enterobacter TaxID=2608935 RepID=UPI000F4A3C08|nr:MULTISPECIES: alpha/beta fold hydrolase [unclassified Enterobacter]ROP48534.1 alpha/beta hydrolase family protein [Enterobacter sp. BIGb0383]ROS00446.1 alpha/beta hydrolase family protein [Enterobacter sp. BIGb0359]